MRRKGLNEKTAYRQLREAIVLIHQLLASFVADWYYLSINSFYEPRLLVDLNNSKLPESSIDIFKPYIETLRKLQQLQRVAYLKERGFLDKTIAIDINATSDQISTSSYKQKLTNTLSHRGYPLNAESQKELKLVQSILNLSEQKVEEISKPILAQKEVEYREQQRQLEQKRKSEQKRELERKRQEEEAFRRASGQGFWNSMFNFVGDNMTAVSAVLFLALLSLFALFLNQ